LELELHVCIASSTRSRTRGQVEKIKTILLYDGGSYINLYAQNAFGFAADDERCGNRTEQPSTAPLDPRTYYHYLLLDFDFVLVQNSNKTLVCSQH